MEIGTPAVYVLSRHIALDDTDDAVRMLGFTPLNKIFIHDDRDLALACVFLPAQEILKTRSQADSVELAQAVYAETGEPSLVVGDAELLDAIWPDGRREALCPTAD
jgi:hypothetical protein